MRKLLLIGGAVTFALLMCAVVVHQVCIWRGNIHPDFYIEWVASWVALQGNNPYSNKTTLAIQLCSKRHKVSELDMVLVLFVVSFFPVPSWLSEFLRVALRYPSQRKVQTGLCSPVVAVRKGHGFWWWHALSG